jgi:hypothetical protein
MQVLICDGEVVECDLTGKITKQYNTKRNKTKQNKNQLVIQTYKEQKTNQTTIRNQKHRKIKKKNKQSNNSCQQKHCK